MLATKKTSKKKIILYGIIIVIMIIGNIYIYHKNSTPTESESIINDLTVNLDLDSTMKNQTNETKAVIENNLFITLKKIGDWPVKPKNIGKTDPFVPFFNK